MQKKRISESEKKVSEKENTKAYLFTFLDMSRQIIRLNPMATVNGAATQGGHYQQLDSNSQK